MPPVPADPTLVGAAVRKKFGKKFYNGKVTAVNAHNRECASRRRTHASRLRMSPLRTRAPAAERIGARLQLAVLHPL
jgi:hypothetical protein